MNGPDPFNPNDEELWRQYAAGRQAPPTRCPSADVLAGYLDGRLPESRREALEGHLAGCPACLAAVRELRSLLDAQSESLIAPPRSVIDSAKALVAAPSHPATVSAQRGFRLADWLPVARWSLTAAASIAICFVGYQIGSSAFAARNGSEDQLIAEISFGVFDPQSERETDAELIAFGYGEAVR